MCVFSVSQEAELDSGTACRPCGGSPVQSHTQTLWGHKGAQGSDEAGACPQQVHTPTHSSPPALTSHPVRPGVTERVRQEGLQDLSPGFWSETCGSQSSVPSHTAGPV